MFQGNTNALLVQERKDSASKLEILITLCTSYILKMLEIAYIKDTCLTLLNTAFPKFFCLWKLIPMEFTFCSRY